MKSPRPSLSVFAYCKQSKTGGVEGLGMRLPRGAISITKVLNKKGAR